jgi:geranylgeranylglycerol-phosphate geranylgeranyltransferase
MDVKGLFLLTRPLNSLLAALAVVLAGFMTHEMDETILLTIASVIFISSGGNAINDYFDFDIDRINKPRRPIPSGKVTLSEALYFSIVMFACGTAIAYFINYACLIIAASASVVLYLYARSLKHMGLPGNLTVAGLTGMAIVYGGISVAGIEKIGFVALFAFLINLSREIVKDTEDVAGDEAAGAHTLAIRYGVSTALRIGAIPALLLIIVTPIPFVMGIYNVYYLAMMIVGVDIPLLYIMTQMVHSPSVQTAERTKKYLKALILVGIIGLYLGI